MRKLIIIIAGILAAGTIYIFRLPPVTESDLGAEEKATKERIPASPAAAQSGRFSLALPARAIGSNLLSDLQRRSSRPWLTSWAQGAISRLSGARLSLGENEPRAAADKFISDYGSLLGVNAGDLSRDLQRQMNGNVQVLYSQHLAGLPVFDSRVNMIFDGEINLIYLSSNVYSGAPVSSAAKRTLAQAAELAASGLVEFRAARSDGGETISAAALSQRAQLGYRLVGGNIALVYKFTFTIPNSPLGDMEIVVEDSSGTLLVVRSLSRT